MAHLAMNVPRIVPYAKCYEAQVLALAREMHDESVFHRHIPMDETKLIQQLEAASAMPDTAYFKLCVRGDEVIGVFLGVISTVYFSTERIAMDRAWFVPKNRRFSLAAVMLVADFEAWASALGVHFCMLEQATGVRMDATQSLYEHLGYTVLGVNTMKRI